MGEAITVLKSAEMAYFAQKGANGLYIKGYCDGVTDTWKCVAERMQAALTQIASMGAPKEGLSVEFVELIELLAKDDNAKTIGICTQTDRADIYVELEDYSYDARMALRQKYIDFKINNQLKGIDLHCYCKGTALPASYILKG